MDDEQAVRAALREMLQDEGYGVLEAADGGAMLAVVEHERVDLVLMDVMMPGGDGRAAYRELQARSAFLAVPVIMMSALVQPEDLDPSLAAFLRKPFDLDHLLALVRTLIGSPSNLGSTEAG